MKFVIMAGGSGTKLWPISREEAPKQFYPLIGTRTPFQLNVEALLERYSPLDLYVATNKKQIHFVQEQAPQIPFENYIIEPELKESGPACCLSMMTLMKDFPDEVVMFCVQSAITRSPTDVYLDMVETLGKLVAKYGKLSTGVNIPKYIETGSDLLRLGEKIPGTNGNKVFEVTDFINVVRDRMHLEEVRKIAEENAVGYHSNHYTWTPRKFLDTVQELRPDWYKLLMQMQNVMGAEDEFNKVAELYHKFEPGRIELVTQELMKRGEVLAVVLPYKWFHITTWDDVYRYYKEEKISPHQTEVVEIDSKNNLILSDTKKLITLIGMEDFAVIETPDSILITPRKLANRVKDVHDALKTRGMEEYL